MINVEDLFSKRILEYQVTTKRYGRRAYVNLDNAATTPPLSFVEKAVADFLTSYGSVHRGAGTKSNLSSESYDFARETIKNFVNAPSESYLVFTGNTTGAMNVLAHYFSFLRGKVAVSAIEHSSSWLPWVVAEGNRALGQAQVPIDEVPSLHKLIQDCGHAQVIRYDVNSDFEFDLTSIEALLKRHRIKALVLTASSNVTGYTPDIKAIGELAHRYGAYFVVDACQFIQHHALDMQALGIDFVAASGHKFYAPFGGGFLIRPKKFFDSFLPYQIGGGNLAYISAAGELYRYASEQAHDPGTPNAVGAVSMAAALQELGSLGFDEIEAHEHGLAREAYTALAKNKRIRLYVTEKNLSTVILFSIEGMNYREVSKILNDDFGIGVRAGSFCVYDVMRKLLHIEDDEEIVNGVLARDKSKMPGVLRASFALCNRERDAEALIEALDAITGYRRALPSNRIVANAKTVYTSSESSIASSGVPGLTSPLAEMAGI